MKKLFLISLMIVLVVALAFGACAKPAPAPTPTPAPSPAPAPAQEPIKIGIMYPLTGALATTGQLMANAAEFAFEQAGYQVAGKKIEVFVEDSGEPAPTMLLDKARKLVEYNKVNILIGPLTLGGKRTVGGYMAQAEVPQLATHFNLINMSQFPWSIMVGGSNLQVCSTMGLYTYQEMGIKTVTAMTYDDDNGHGFFGAFKEGFEKAGGKVIQEQYTTRPCQDFGPHLAVLKDADAVAAWFGGADAIRFLTQYNEFGIRKRMPMLAVFFGTFVEPFILNAVLPEVAEASIGERAPTTYTPDIDTPANKKFVADIKAKFGYIPSEADAGAYMASQIALKALEMTGGDTTPDRLRQAILSIDIDTPEAHLRFDPQTRFPIRDVYIVKIDKKDGGYGWTLVKTYKDVPPGGP